jgi:hypothetical protein
MLAGILVLGAALRAVTMLAYRPALLYPDSLDYLGGAMRLTPGGWHPLGYSILLRPLLAAHCLMVVPAVQHAMGLGMAVIIYAVVLRLGCRRWAAALAAVPVLFSAYQLDIEQYIMSDTLFELLLLVTLTLLVWRRRPPIWVAILAGLALVAAVLTRYDALMVVVPVIVFLLIRRVGVMRILALLLAFIVPLLAYAGWYDSINGAFEITGLSGLILYARVAPFADCHGLKLPSYERVLCQDTPPPSRPSALYYQASPHSPGRSYRPPPGLDGQAVLQNFAERIILHQPLTYARVVAGGFALGLRPTHIVAPVDQAWQFKTSYYPVFGVSYQQVRSVMRAFGGGRPAVDQPLARFLRAYQTGVYLPGSLLGALMLAGLLAALGLGRASRSDLRADCLLFSLVCIVLLAFATATTVFTWRYELPWLVLLPPGGVLAIRAMVLGRPARLRGEPPPAPELARSVAGQRYDPNGEDGRAGSAPRRAGGVDRSPAGPGQRPV